MRTLSYANLHRCGARNCENLVLMCMDFRFHRQIADLLSSAGYGSFDVLALPGASKAVADEGTCGAFLAALDTAITLHGIKRVMIIDHVDCGAYGGSSSFGSFEEEEEFHMEALRQAGEVIRDTHPSVEVVGAYMDWSSLRVYGPGVMVPEVSV